MLGAQGASLEDQASQVTFTAATDRRLGRRRPRQVPPRTEQLNTWYLHPLLSAVTTPDALIDSGSLESFLHSHLSFYVAWFGKPPTSDPCALKRRIDRCIVKGSEIRTLSTVHKRPVRTDPGRRYATQIDDSGGACSACLQSTPCIIVSGIPIGII